MCKNHKLNIPVTFYSSLMKLCIREHSNFLLLSLTGFSVLFFMCALGRFLSRTDDSVGLEHVLLADKV